MLNENAKKWVAALRSGKYTQTRHKLTDLHPSGKIAGCCCLGVACELAVKNGLSIIVNDTAVGRSYAGHVSVLPIEVQTWLGLKTASGHFEPTYPSEPRQLSSKNDGGATFSEIADIIEAKASELFVEAT